MVLAASIDDLKYLLFTLGYTSSIVDITDERDPELKALIRRYQIDAGLSSDGKFGPFTALSVRAKLNKLSNMPAGIKQFRRFRLTNYYVAQEYENNIKTVPVYSHDGSVIDRVSPDFFASLSLEGTGKLADGRLINVDGNTVPVNHDDYSSVLDIAKRNNWIPSKSEYAGIVISLTNTDYVVVRAFSFRVVADAEIGAGYGLEHGQAKVPFKTVASDIGAYRTSEPMYRGKGGLVPIGTKVFVLEYYGAKLPDNTTHDGWVTAIDTGGAIAGAHFDVFTGTRIMARQVTTPNIGHVWFEGAEEKIPFGYSYGI